jgi:hypothetical protein
MGTISHNTIVVTDSNHEWLEKAAAKARELGAIVLGPSEPGTNAYRTLVLCPDGSKEGWGTSNEGDARRDAFVAWLSAQREEYPDWVEVRYGELGYSIVRSDEDPGV